MYNGGRIPVLCFRHPMITRQSPENCRSNVPALLTDLQRRCPNSTNMYCRRIVLIKLLSAVKLRRDLRNPKTINLHREHGGRKKSPADGSVSKALPVSSRAQC